MRAASSANLQPTHDLEDIRGQRDETMTDRSSTYLSTHKKQAKDKAENGDSKFPKDYFSWTYKLVQGFSSFSIDTFFGDVDVVGLDNIPATGPVILVGNHKNQFVDAMMVVAVVRSRKVSFLVAEKSMHRRFIGDGARMMGSIPVIRPQDRARAAQGIITGYDAESHRILGSGDCSFTTTLTKGEMLVLHGIKGVAPLVVMDVSSDTSVTIRPPVKSEDEPDAGQPASIDIPSQGVSYKVIPKVDQSEVFHKVEEALCQGRCIGIFPEGGSSDRTDLLPLKAGVAVMALGSAVKGAPVKIIPFGINYSDSKRWRSKVFIDVGKPMTVDPALIEKSRAGSKREAQAELLKQVEKALRSVTFNAPDEHTLNILRTMRRLYQGRVKLPAKNFMELNRRFAMAFGKFRDDDRFLDLVARVHDYMSKVKALGIVDRQVAELPPLGSPWVSFKALIRLISLFVFTVLLMLTTVPGWFIFAPMLLRVRFVAQAEAKRALAGSSVKVRGADVEASQKIISTSIWVPVTMMVMVGIAVGLTVGLWPKESPYAAGTVGDWFFINAIWLIPLSAPLFTLILGLYTMNTWDRCVSNWNWLPFYMLIVTSMCRPNSAGNRIRSRRMELTLRIQEFYDKIIAPAFPEWSSDLIIPRETLLANRRKSEHVRAIVVAEEVDQLSKQVPMPDSPTLSTSRKTIAGLKESMMRMQEDVSRFEAPDKHINRSVVQPVFANVEESDEKV